MDKPNNEELIELIARTLLRAVKRLDTIEEAVLHNEDILRFLEDVFAPSKNDIIPPDEQLVAFPKDLYKQICKYCGKNGIKFMGIA